MSDEEASLARAADVIAAQHSPTGGDTAAPTTFLIDRRGTVRSVLRRKSYLARVTPAELLAAVEGAFRE